MTAACMRDISESVSVGQVAAWNSPRISICSRFSLSHALHLQHVALQHASLLHHQRLQKTHGASVETSGKLPPLVTTVQHCVLLGQHRSVLHLVPSLGARAVRGAPARLRRSTSATRPLTALRTSLCSFCAEATAAVDLADSTRTCSCCCCCFRRLKYAGI